MIAYNLERILGELPSGVKLVAVSKFHPMHTVLEAYQHGQRAFGENRPQEFAMKAVQLPQDIEWHFIGHLQTNKLKLVLPYASLVESIDSVHLLDAVNAWGERNDRSVKVLLEVHIGAEQSKSGFAPEDVPELLRSVLAAREAGLSDGAYPRIVFCGLMGMASNTDDEEIVRSDFARIETLFDSCRERFPGLKEFRELSIGMSGDWRIALEYGSTEVRIGTAIFGERQYL